MLLPATQIWQRQLLQVNSVTSEWFCSCWIKQNGSVEMFKGLKYSLCRAQWAPVGVWVCSQQQQSWEPVPGCTSCRLTLCSLLGHVWGISQQPGLTTGGWISASPSPALLPFSRRAPAALRLSEQADSVALASTRSFWLKRLKLLSLFSWLFGKVDSDKCGINLLPACPHCIGSKYLSPAFPLDVSVEDADTACELALWLEWYWLLWYKPFKFHFGLLWFITPCVSVPIYRSING